MKINFCVPCLLGLEGLIADELRAMDAEDVRAENGRVFFAGDAHMLARANIRSRFAERILVQFSCRDLVIVHVRLIGLHLEVVVSAKLEDGIAIVVGHLTCRLIVIIDGKLEFLTHFGDGYGVGTESAWWQPHLGNFQNWFTAGMLLNISSFSIVGLLGNLTLFTM